MCIFFTSYDRAIVAKIDIVRKAGKKMKKFLRYKKRVGAFALASMIAFGAMGVPTFAAQKLYDQVTTETITKGVTYEFNHRLTADGWQDIHVLKVNLTDPNIAVAPVESSKEYGLKDTVLNMISDAGAVAGVNADFFGLKGNYSASFGPVIKDGNIISVGTDKNLNGYEYGAFFINQNGNPFIHFLKVQADFYANTNSHLELASLNKITEMIYPIYFDRNAAATTADLDKRFPELVKFVVENDTITYISQKGETVTVPENGYLIILSGKHYDGVASYFCVGQHTELKLNASIDLNNIKTAIGGAGKILSQGQKVTGQGVVISGRQPRTALGITQDQSTLILMVVDGRSHSIGATHDEMADLLKEYGAYEAMHLDGGGSSTLVAKTIEDDKVEVKNKVSEGTQRRVMDAVGVFNNSSVGEVNHIKLIPSAEKVFTGNEVSFDVVGYDEYYHKIEMPSDEVSFAIDKGAGSFAGRTLTPTTAGEITVSATWRGASGSVSIESMEAAAITAQERISLSDAGQSATIKISGIDKDGFTAPISSGVTYQLSDETLGTLSGNVFTASKKGSGYVEATMGNAKCQIPISVGVKEEMVTSFEGQGGIIYNSFPKTGIAGSAVLSDKKSIDGKNSLELNYQFLESDAVQAAYVSFSKAIVVPGKPTALKLSVFGNGSGHMVRAKGTDAAGKDIILEFTKAIDWQGEWKELTAVIPAGTTYPIKIDNMYCASMGNTTSEKQTVYFDKLVGVYENAVEDVPAKTTQLTDVRQKQVKKADDGAYYINIIGRVSSGTVENKQLYEAQRKKAKAFAETEANLAIYAGKNDISPSTIADTIQWNGSYQYYNKPNVSIVQMTAANGGLRNTNAAQWLKFKNDILASSNPNVIFIMDRTPSDFNDAMETVLFRSVLQEIRKAGKTVFVISASDVGYWQNLKDGIRYINLPNLWTASGQVNSNFTKLKLRVNGSDITYEAVKMSESY